MAGLLDFYNDPRQQAMLGLAGGLLSAGAPSNRPTSFGSALGQGLLTSAQMFNNATQVQEAKQLKELQAETMRQQLAQRAFQQQIAQQLMGGSLPGGAPAAPVGLSDSSAAGLGAPWAASSNIPQASPAPATGAPSQGGFPLNPAQLAALKMAGLPDLTPMFNASRPNVEVKDGVMYDKNTGQVISTIPTMNQQGFATQLVPDGRGGYTVRVVQGAEDAYRLQQGITQGEQARYNFQRDVPLPDANGVLRPTTISAFNLAQALPAPAVPGVPSPMGGPSPAPAAPSPAPSPAPAAAPTGGKMAPAVEMLMGEVQAQLTASQNAPDQGTRDQALKNANEAAAQLKRLGVSVNVPELSGRKPGQGLTPPEQAAQDARAKAQSTSGELDARRINDLEQKIPSLMAVGRRLDRMEALTKDDRTFAAAGAELKTTLGSVAQAFGLKVNDAKTANSEEYLAHVAELLKDRLASKDYGSGSGVSNVDLLAAKAPLPELARTPLGRMQIITALRADLQRNITDANAARDFYDQNNSLRGFRFPSERQSGVLADGAPAPSGWSIRPVGR